MKTKRIVFTLICAALAAGAWAQTFTEKITRELDFEKKGPANTIVLDNINGRVKVQGYSGEKILVEVVKTIYGKTEARLEKGKQEVQLGVIDDADTLVLFVKGDDCSRYGRVSRGHHSGRSGWGYQGNCNDGNCNTTYSYRMDFSLKVPFAANLIISTINEGDVVVSDITGAVDARNINGAIKLSGLAREVNASTINGDVDVDYVRNPDQPSRYYTLNGNINANFRKGLAASMRFESFNGSLYTNVAQLEALPAIIVRNSEQEGLKYKLNGNRFKIGGGGVDLDFETFNGNVYVKEIN